GVRGRAARRAAGTGQPRRLRDHRPRAQGSRDRGTPVAAADQGRRGSRRDRCGYGMTFPIHVRAPATTANLGSGFDCAGVALDLWNELEVTTGDGGPGLEHLGVRAFARLADPAGLRFAFTDRIPRARGLGSSAAVTALGLVAATLANGGEPDPEELLAEGIELEGHGDNLAPALAG